MAKLVIIVNVLIKSDRNGLCGGAIVTVVLALWCRVDTFLAIGLALAERSRAVGNVWDIAVW
jgi:hypothetical protein